MEWYLYIYLKSSVSDPKFILNLCSFYTELDVKGLYMILNTNLSQNVERYDMLLDRRESIFLFLISSVWNTYQRRYFGSEKSTLLQRGEIDYSPIL